MTSQDLDEIKEAIATAERCEAYTDDRHPCEGLDACDDCLELAAKAVLEVAEARRP